MVIFRARYFHQRISFQCNWCYFKARYPCQNNGTRSWWCEKTVKSKKLYGCWNRTNRCEKFHPHQEKKEERREILKRQSALTCRFFTSYLQYCMLYSTCTCSRVLLIVKQVQVTKNIHVRTGIFILCTPVINECEHIQHFITCEYLYTCGTCTAVLYMYTKSVQASFSTFKLHFKI